MTGQAGHRLLLVSPPPPPGATPSAVSLRLGYTWPLFLHTSAGVNPAGSVEGVQEAAVPAAGADSVGIPLRYTRHRLRRSDNAWLRLERSAPIRVVSRSGSGR